MNQIPTLLRREWIQHRFGWGLIVLLPTALALLLVSFGEMKFDAQEIGERLPVALTLGSLGGAVGIQLLIMWLTSLIIVTGLARRDHADRSVEFWLSLPVGHARSLSVPLATHLLLAPAAALLTGLISGLLISLVLVSRTAGIDAWFALPWLPLALAALAIVARLALGLLLVTLWLSPLLLLAVLLTAWFRRWGLVILGVGIGLGSQILERVFGQPLLSDVLSELLSRAGRSLANYSAGKQMVFDRAEDIQGALMLVPRWALADGTQALGLLATPLLPGALLVAAGCFALLVQWRQRGAGAAG